MLKRYLSLLILLTFITACTRVPRQIEPTIAAPCHPKEIQRERRNFLCLPDDFSISPFTPLTPEEAASDWGKEYRIALAFADDFDLYRAITGFKRALFLLPPDCSPDITSRRLEIEYAIALGYYLGKKYIETIYSIESTELIRVEQDFPAFHDLLLILYDCYGQTGRFDYQSHILNLIDAKESSKLSLLQAVQCADFDKLSILASADPEHSYLNTIVCSYKQETKSIRKAQYLNAILPGAGYWYVGLKSTAVTAFLMNALFITAAAECFAHHHVAAGIVALSFESGWYFGGITGAGLSAKMYNEKLYCNYAGKITQREDYFPLFMLRYTF